MFNTLTPISKAASAKGSGIPAPAEAHVEYRTDQENPEQGRQSQGCRRRDGSLRHSLRGQQLRQRNDDEPADETGASASEPHQPHWRCSTLHVATVVLPEGPNAPHRPVLAGFCVWFPGPCMIPATIQHRGRSRVLQWHQKTSRVLTVLGGYLPSCSSDRQPW